MRNLQGAQADHERQVEEVRKRQLEVDEINEALRTMGRKRSKPTERANPAAHEPRKRGHDDAHEGDETRGDVSLEPQTARGDVSLEPPSTGGASSSRDSPPAGTSSMDVSDAGLAAQVGNIGLATLNRRWGAADILELQIEDDWEQRCVREGLRDRCARHEPELLLIMGDATSCAVRRFTAELCLLQHSAGRYFMVEATGSGVSR